MFHVRNMILASFKSYWKTVRHERANWPLKVTEVIVTKRNWQTQGMQSSGPGAVAALVQSARKKGQRDGARAMAERVASIRNENVLLLNAAAKSEHARAQVNQVHAREG